MAAARIEGAIRTLRMTENELRVRIHAVDSAYLDWTPGPDDWSTRQIVGHLADAELALGFRIRKILAEEDPAYPAFDEERWTEREGHARADLETLFSAWQGLRRWHLALLERLSDEDLARTGRHEQAGQQTLAQVVEHMAAHDRYHLARMDELAKAQGRNMEGT